MGVLAPRAKQYVPAGHFVQAGLPIEAYHPRGHFSQEVTSTAPAFELYRPYSHGAQVVGFGFGSEYHPAGQVVPQVCPSAEYWEDVVQAKHVAELCAPTTVE